MKISLLISLVFISFLLIAQDDFKVIKVNGTIVVQKTNAQLETGSIFSEKDKLEFKTSNARAAVINSVKGRFVLMPDNDDLAYAKANFTPAMSNIASRSGTPNNLFDLQGELSGTYAILDKVKININEELYPMNEQKFFYIRYDYKGETINKKLSYNADTLIIDKSELLTIDGLPIPNPDISKMEILYMEQDDNNKRKVISEFDPVFLNPDELLVEVKVILDELKDANKQEKIDEVISYINDFYGKPNRDNITQWLEKNIEL